MLQHRIGRVKDNDWRTMDKYKRRVVFNGIAAFFAVALMVTVAILSRDTQLSEKATRTVTYAFTNSLGRLSSALPFSLFELLVAIAVIVALYLIIKAIALLAKRRFFAGLCSFTTLVATVLCVVSVYMLDTSFAYNREKPPLDIYANGDLTEEQQLDAIDGFMTDFLDIAYSLKRDENGLPACDLSVEDISRMIAEEYAKLDDDYYCDYIPVAKGLTASALMSELSLIGITFTPIGEANVNEQAPVSDRIFTTAHEMAHAMGIMREEDANLVATYVLINSDNDLLRYAAMMEYYGRLTSLVELLDAEKSVEYENAIKESPIATEASFEFKFWMSTGSFYKLSEFFNNLYLRFNGQDLGTGSYNDGNFWEVTPSEPDDDGNVTYEIELSDIQLVLLTRYAV